MFNQDNIIKVATSALGALILSTTLVGAAVGPARAVETAPAAYAQAQASDQAHG